jgi:hypothetical protein
MAAKLTILYEIHDGFVRHTAEGKKLLAKLEKRFGKGKALSILAQSSGAPPTTSCCAARRSRSSRASHARFLAILPFPEPADNGPSRSTVMRMPARGHG